MVEEDTGKSYVTARVILYLVASKKTVPVLQRRDYLYRS